MYTPEIWRWLTYQFSHVAGAVGAARQYAQLYFLPPVSATRKTVVKDGRLFTSVRDGRKCVSFESGQTRVPAQSLPSACPIRKTYLIVDR